MIDEILNDFFTFISKDNKYITSEDLKRVEITLDNHEFQDILVQLEDFLDEFVDWSLKKLNISIELMENSNSIDLAVQEERSRSNSKNQKNANSIKNTAIKNIDLVQTKSTSFGKSFRYLIRLSNVQLQITFEMLQEYFDSNNHHLNTILKFITRMQTILIQERLERKTKSTSKFRRIIPGEKNFPNPKRPKGEGRKRKSNAGINIIENQPIISECVSDISNDDIGEHKSVVSDNIISKKSKVNFLKVMKGLTKNVINEIQTRGKEMPMKLDDTIKKNLFVENKQLIKPKSKNNEEILPIKEVSSRDKRHDNVHDVSNRMQLDESNIPINISQNNFSLNSNIIEEISNNRRIVKFNNQEICKVIDVNIENIPSENKNNLTPVEKVQKDSNTYLSPSDAFSSTLPEGSSLKKNKNSSCNCGIF